MLERTEWRRYADDPKTPLGWIFGVDRWRGIPIYPLVATAVAATTAIREGIERLLPVGWGEPVGMIVSTSAFAILVANLSPKRRQVLAPDPAPGAFHSTSMRIALRTQDLGMDRGNVAFNDGWLLFEGERTSFALKRDDLVEVHRVGDGRRLDLRSGHRLRFREVEEALRADLDRWIAGARVPGLSRLPPTDVHPERRARPMALAELVSAGLLGGVVALSLTTLPWSSHPRTTVSILTVGTTLSLGLALVARSRTRRVG